MHTIGPRFSSFVFLFRARNWWAVTWDGTWGVGDDGAGMQVSIVYDFLFFFFGFRAFHPLFLSSPLLPVGLF